ncbi:RNA-dependent RNA polymerase [Drosophila ananassae sigmavirus]|uniref:Replicase n=2 Tax=Drosophila ananassae sigmavirus TaxID=1002359 RepID=A0A140D8L0_9RHAB|nr:RNA-dependent RNA polymerase [Drosophila ananassae sigmavirus]AMK09234.1 RNA-dependent RNA polymerase [Drosophila ananassae sigmavirus]
MEEDSFSQFLTDPMLDDEQFNLFEDSDIPSVPGSSITGLSNNDYSLNSPLVADEMVEYVRYVKYGTTSKRWSMKRWESRRTIMERHVNLDKLLFADSFHKFFAEFNLYHPEDSTEFKELLTESINDSKDTMEIPNAFIRGWIGPEFVPRKEVKFTKEILRWGSFFWELHQVILCLNAKTHFEATNLSKWIKMKLVWCEERKGMSVDLKNFGLVLMSEGFVYFKNHNILLDRNCVLMMKDTYAARFHTLLAMSSRVDKKFTNLDIDKMNEIYKLGDELLAREGSDGYKGLKLIEPICNLRLTELARKYRDKIPRFPKFKVHVTNKVRALGTRFHPISTMSRLIMKEDSVELVLTIYGSFRHWGHPMIDYKAGLEALYSQVNAKKIIDRIYAEQLASDLALRVLKYKFHQTKTWYVDVDLMDDSPMKDMMRQNLYPTPAMISDFGDNWHKLPLKKCFNIPEMIDPSLIYSDKSHSIQYNELVDHLQGPNRNLPVPSKKVLTTLLEREATNWPEFLERVDKVGLPSNSLLIGLKLKEREQKDKGRFFSLMSWELRDYFVFTEYLIKTHFVPLFEGLTMADDLTTVTQKMLSSSSGQGNDDYNTITIANHIDYEKWNNHQRGDANGPVFKVMGQFLGYPNLIARTHEFFEKSLIYYSDRADLMMVRDGKVVNMSDFLVCWDGQKGGLEGLRQKGWSIVNLLVIEREGKSRNTTVQTLAQGDNQVICMKYKPRTSSGDRDLIKNLQEIVQNNNNLMSNIEGGTKRLGLIINNDETMQSADYLNYGKVPVFRGNIRGLETKRWSRVTCATNDQLPSLGNIMATVTSNALTVSHHSTSCINSIYHMNLLGSFVRNIIMKHNPSIQSAPLFDPDSGLTVKSRTFKILSVYLDPSLGGVSGTSLTRFLIRAFPDPITEALTFWRIIHNNTVDNDIKLLCAKVGNPRTVPFQSRHISKLAEDPQSLNIPRGISSKTMIKEEIKYALLLNRSKIKNEVVSSILDHIQRDELSLWTLLESIKPRFPRFISELRASTFSGLANEIVGLFQNSRTIRNQFKHKFSERVNKVIMQSELLSIKTLCKYDSERHQFQMWSCSSQKADNLRVRSWGDTVVGATIPHPMEMTTSGHLLTEPCNLCNLGNLRNQYIAVHLPEGLTNYTDKRGPCAPYLGSRTSESTSILTPWERESKVPLIKRAMKLRNSIGWFIDPDSNLAKTICDNLTALTGEDWSGKVTNYRRTGSALHRFSSSRQNTGGYAAQSPAKLTWINSTTNTLTDIGDQNYDFIFQSLLIYSQVTVGELHDGIPAQGCYHFHLTCLDCLRPIEEPTLETEMKYKFQDMSKLLEKWKPENVPWSHTRDPVYLPQGDWSAVANSRKSYHIGRAEGFVFGTGSLSKTDHIERANLFPLSFRGKVCPINYMEGLLDGLVRSSAIEVINRRQVIHCLKPQSALMGSILNLIRVIGTSPSLITLWRTDDFLDLFYQSRHKVPDSYPLKDVDLTSLGTSYLRELLANSKQYITWGNYKPERIWIFADLDKKKWIGLFGISTKLLPILCNPVVKSTSFQLFRDMKSLTSSILTMDFTYIEPPIDNVIGDLVGLDREVRHALKCDSYDFIKENLRARTIGRGQWGREYICKVQAYDVHYDNGQLTDNPTPIPNVPKFTNPSISGFKTFQCSSNAHFKLRGIIHHIHFKPNDIICGADGSGGMSAMLLREFSTSRLIFNSFLKMEGVSLRGSNPSPPSAIHECIEVRDRCINLMDVWQNPSDLALGVTWTYFRRLIHRFNLKVNLMVFDMEYQSEEITRKIEENLILNLDIMKDRNCCVIYKTYLGILYNQQENVLTRIGPLFKSVQVMHTELTSSQSSEVYVVMQFLKRDNIFRRNVNLAKLISDTMISWPVFQSIDSEIDRAQSVMRMDLMMGVPRSLRIDPFIELGSVLRSLGVQSGTTFALLGVGDKHSEPIPPYQPILVYLVSMNSIFDVIMESSHPLNIPSDETVLNIGSLMIGFMLWYGHQFDLRYEIARCLSILNNNFPFNWGCLETSGGRFRQVSSLCNKMRDRKYLNMASKIGLISHLMRLFHLAYGNMEMLNDTKTLDNALKKFNAGFNCKRLGVRNGVISDIHSLSPIITEEASPGFEIMDPTGLEEVVWRS